MSLQWSLQMGKRAQTNVAANFVYAQLKNIHKFCDKYNENKV